jgi:hypothetical protein
MRILVALFVAGAGLLCAEPESAISLSNGVRVLITPSLKQVPDTQTLTPEIAPSAGTGIYRIFRDQNRLAVFAYELGFELTPDGSHVRVLVKPAGDAFAKRFPNADAGKPTPTVPADRSYGPLATGERASIELFDVPPNGAVADTVQVTLGSAGAAGSDQLRFAGLRVSVDRRPIAAGPARAVSGQYVMFFVPGRGGYFFATAPPPGHGFIKAGSVEGRRMQFTVDNQSWDCVSQDSILVHADRGEIWVYHDPQYQPQGNWTQSTPSTKPGEEQFFTAAADSLKWWLP